MGALEVVRELAEAVTSRRSLRLWDVELAGAAGGSVVRVFVDSPEGVDLDTVAQVSADTAAGAAAGAGVDLQAVITPAATTTERMEATRPRRTGAQ